MKERFENFNGIRIFSAIGILCMHVLIMGAYPKAAAGTVLYDLVSKLGILLQLFFMFSGFGLCCGYYDQFK